MKNKVTNPKPAIASQCSSGRARARVGGLSDSLTAPGGGASLLAKFTAVFVHGVYTGLM